MLKKLLLIAALLFGSTAFAGTITLGAENCGHFRVCSAVPTGTSDVVALNANPAYTDVTVVVNGVTYTAQAGNSSTITALTLYAPDGSYVVLDATFVMYRTLVRSGHNFWVWYWKLTGGAIVSP